MKKRLMAMLLVVSMLVGTLVACGEKVDPTDPPKATDATKTTDAPKETEAPTEAKGVFNETGFPIVNEEVTLVIGVAEVTSATQGKFEDLNLIKYIEEKSGVNLEFKYYNKDTCALMFADGDYPDVMMELQTAQQVADAVAAGDVYPLNDLIEKYSPNWSKFLAENKRTKNLMTHADGNIYSLATIREEPINSGLRDQMLIRKDWLDELGLKVPTTIEELYNVLVAFRDNAGKGSIPEDVEPLAFRTVTLNTTGLLDVFNFYGLLLSGWAGSYYLQLDDDGNAVFNWADERAKEPLEFLHKLVDEGLVSKDCFTVDSATHSTKVSLPLEQRTVGVWFAFHNDDLDMDQVVPFGPLDAGNGATPMMRSQANAVTLNKWTIFKNCEYPEVAMRIADMFADPQISLECMYGMAQDGFIEVKEDGMMTVLDVSDSGMPTYDSFSGTSNRVPFLLTEEMFDKVVYEPGALVYTRYYAANEVYREKITSADYLYPPITVSEENSSKFTQLYTDLKKAVDKAYSSFVLDGGVEEGWDAYIANLEALGLEEYLKLAQEELDAFNAK